MKLFLSWFFYMRFLKACWTVIKDPYQTEQVARTSDFLANPSAWKTVFQEMSKSSELREWYSRKPNPPRVVKAELEKLDTQSFGKALFVHLDKNNLDPTLFPLEPRNEIDYIRNYYRQSHDIWHVATGYSTSVADELALMTFTFAQNKSPGAVIIIVLVLLHGALFNQTDLTIYFDKMNEGWRRGNQARKLMAIDWESQYSKPLQEVRAEFNLV